MIGIFDSGSGGLTFLAAMKRRFPTWSYLYYADYEHCPFGERPPEEIRQFTIMWVQKLFDTGASIVILACNTASAWTLRSLQTEVFPGKKILGVTIPGAEKVVENGWKNIIVFATEQTVKSRTYSERMHLLDQHIRVTEIAFPADLVRDIELLLPLQQCHSEEDFQTLYSHYSESGWNFSDANWHHIVQQYFSVRNLQFSLAWTQGIVLGCTHYSYLKQLLQKQFPHISIVDPSEEAARKLWIYVEKRPEMFEKIWQTGKVQFIE